MKNLLCNRPNKLKHLRFVGLFFSQEGNRRQSNNTSPSTGKAELSVRPKSTHRRPSRVCYGFSFCSTKGQAEYRFVT